MKLIVIVYATREGHTRKIAEHVAANLGRHGFGTSVKNVCDEIAKIDLSRYSAAILAASVHLGKHEREMVRYVKEHLAELDCMPNAFLSVTLSEAGVERHGQSHEVRMRCEAGVREVIDKFVKETGWHPTHVKAIAGALPYTKYNPLVRFVMKWIAKSEGGHTDTSRDYDYTDWVALDCYVEKLAQEILSLTAGPVSLEV
jgi:menaquinone-dependent protoporphyrinogen oxidase